MKIGYCRVSTTEQVASIVAQEKQLKKEGCEEIFSEMLSAVGERPQLERALAYVHKGDILCVAKLDRLARSVAHLCTLVAALKAKGVALHVLDMGLATNTPTGELMVNLLGSIAQFERSIMLERQRSGIEAARRAGKYKGRKASARAQTANIIELAKLGMTKDKIAAKCGIGVSSVYSILKANGVRRISTIVVEPVSPMPSPQ
jgi:DNA invertase Pin-like site-specific DNA recombinase